MQPDGTWQYSIGLCMEKFQEFPDFSKIKKKMDLWHENLEATVQKSELQNLLTK